MSRRKIAEAFQAWAQGGKKPGPFKNFYEHVKSTYHLPSADDNAILKQMLGLHDNIELGPNGARRLGDQGAKDDWNYSRDGRLTPRSAVARTAGDRAADAGRKPHDVTGAKLLAMCNSPESLKTRIKAPNLDQWQATDIPCEDGTFCFVRAGAANVHAYQADDERAKQCREFALHHIMKDARTEEELHPHHENAARGMAAWMLNEGDGQVYSQRRSAILDALEQRLGQSVYTWGQDAGGCADAVVDLTLASNRARAAGIPIREIMEYLGPDDEDDDDAAGPAGPAMS